MVWLRCVRKEDKDCQPRCGCGGRGGLGVNTNVNPPRYCLATKLAAQLPPTGPDFLGRQVQLLVIMLTVAYVAGTQVDLFLSDLDGMSTNDKAEKRVPKQAISIRCGLVLWRCCFCICCHQINGQG